MMYVRNWTDVYGAHSEEPLVPRIIRSVHKDMKSAIGSQGGETPAREDLGPAAYARFAQECATWAPISSAAAAASARITSRYCAGALPERRRIDGPAEAFYPQLFARRHGSTRTRFGVVVQTPYSHAGRTIGLRT